MRLFLTTLFTALLLVATSSVTAQDERAIEEKRKAIAALEKRIAAEEEAINKIQKSRKNTEERARRLARQIEQRNRLLGETEREAKRLEGEIAKSDRRADSLQTALDRNEKEYITLARESYRNYRQQNYISYIFSSRNFADIARRISAMREMAALRDRKLREIKELKQSVADERLRLDERQHELDSVSEKVSGQKMRLQRDATAAKQEIRTMSNKEKQAMQRKVAQEEQLSVAISELRKLTKGNKEGASFSKRTSGLNLPVVGGHVKRYKGNMAEITGSRGATVRSIYEGKVVDVKRNRITAKYEVFVAHGEYITSYTNLGSIAVEKNQKVAKNQALGTVGAAVNVTTMETEYKLVFGIYSPNPNETLSASTCFKK
ncbi:MAG: peptidoglycan DD-metalloendopeptidase family protein [Rikenellaceae bacterium]|nr:peptidoglycan DD-metalloendopeptidase family protein [Rikenellaceae bacterium]